MCLQPEIKQKKPTHGRDSFFRPAYNRTSTRLSVVFCVATRIRENYKKKCSVSHSLLPLLVLKEKPTMVLYDIYKHYKWKYPASLIDKKKTNRKNAWSKVTHASHANIVNFHARGLRTPRATRARKLTLGCALLLLLLLAHRIIKKKVLIHTLEKVSLHSKGSFINHIVSNFPIRVISAEIVIDIYCLRAELSWLMTLLIAFLISQ